MAAQFYSPNKSYNFLFLLTFRFIYTFENIIVGIKYENAIE